jgi:hypothetical protein
MNKAAVVGLFLLALPTTSLSQSPADTQFLLRLKYIKSDLPLSVSTTCIAVYADGRFHLEQAADWHASKTKVYEDSLSGDDLNSLRAIVDDPQLKQLSGIDTSKVAFSQNEHGEVVWAVIPRGDTTQRVIFNSQTGTATQHSKELPKSLNALIGWSDSVSKLLQKRKVHALSNGTPVNCWMDK